ncbi:unnamed protein product, partial [Orchesella dallaii]
MTSAFPKPFGVPRSTKHVQSAENDDECTFETVQSPSIYNKRPPGQRNVSSGSTDNDAVDNNS